MNPKRLSWLIVGLLALAVVLAACQAEPETVEVTRIVTELQEVEVEVPVEVEVEVTRVVTEVTTETVTEIVEVEAEVIALGSAERPIQVLFVGSGQGIGYGGESAGDCDGWNGWRRRGKRPRGCDPGCGCG